KSNSTRPLLRSPRSICDSSSRTSPPLAPESLRTGVEVAAPSPPPSAPPSSDAGPQGWSSAANSKRRKMGCPIARSVTARPKKATLAGDRSRSREEGGRSEGGEEEERALAASASASAPVGADVPEPSRGEGAAGVASSSAAAAASDLPSPSSEAAAASPPSPPRASANSPSKGTGATGEIVARRLPPPPPPPSPPPSTHFTSGRLLRRGSKSGWSSMGYANVAKVSSIACSFSEASPTPSKSSSSKSSSWTSATASRAASTMRRRRLASESALLEGALEALGDALEDLGFCFAETPPPLPPSPPPPSAPPSLAVVDVVRSSSSSALTASSAAPNRPANRSHSGATRSRALVGRHANLATAIRSRRGSAGAEASCRIPEGVAVGRRVGAAASSSSPPSSFVPPSSRFAPSSRLPSSSRTATNLSTLRQTFAAVSLTKRSWPAAQNSRARS
ncbi:hypothetical protein ACHAWF_016339, partial [Thalassiosira exigua]